MHGYDTLFPFLANGRSEYIAEDQAHCHAGLALVDSVSPIAALTPVLGINRAAGIVRKAVIHTCPRLCEAADAVIFVPSHLGAAQLLTRLCTLYLAHII